MNNTPIGEEKRHKTRCKHIARVTLKAEQLFKDAFSNAEMITNSEQFSERWDKFEERLFNTFGQQKDFRLSFKHGENLLKKYKEKYGWSYSPTSTIITNTPAKQYRDTQWLNQAWALYDAYQEWRNSHLDNSIGDINSRYQTLLLSLIFESGQGNIDVVMSFHKQVTEKGIDNLKRFNCYSYLTLTLDNEQLNTNAIINDERITQFHCFLSIQTLAQLRLWDKIDTKAWKAPVGVDAVFNLLTKNIIKHKHTPTTLKRWCGCAMFWYEHNVNNNLSEALLEFRVGRTVSYSLPSDNLIALLSPKISPVESASFYHFKSDINVKLPNKSLRTSRSTITLISSQFYDELKTIFQKSNSKHKISPSKMTEFLIHFLDMYQLESWQVIFVEWLIYKLQGCKVSTTKNYFQILIKDWNLLNTIHNLTLQTDSEAIEALYQQQIDRHKTEKSKVFFTKRLQDLHGFCSSNLNLPPLGDEFFHVNHNQKHTRSGLISDPLFTQLLTHINTLTDINAFDKLALQSICIISYRCGLRINEIYKLQIRNIHSCSVGWIEVRPNQLGDNKSASSLRKVPLFPLLLKHEESIVSEYLRYKREIAKSTATPLFNIGYDIHKPFDKFSVSSYVGAFLKATSGLSHLVFHHLRHSCLTRLQLMLELKDANKVFPYFYSYAEEQHDRIHSLIFKKTLTQGYWEIAQFAGHESPEMTFKHYFHFSDLLAAPSANYYQQSLTLENAMKHGYLSRRQFQYINRKVNNVTVAHAYKRLIRSLHIQSIVDIKEPINQPTVNLINTNKERYSIELCHCILEAISQGIDIQSLAYKYRLKQETIDKWLKNTNYLKSLETNTSINNPGVKKYHRHFHHSRANALTPGRLKTKEEKEYIKKFNIKLRDYYPKHTKEIQVQILYALTHRSINQSGILFSNPKALTTFISELSFAIPKSHWRAITLYMKSSTIKAEWKESLKGLKTISGKEGVITGRSGHGSVRLELINPTEQKMIQNNHMTKYSSHLLVYILYFTFVMVANIDGIN